MKYNAGYPSIKEVGQFVNRKVTIAGVVVESSLPRKSRGTDYVSILKIVDESQQCPELTVSVFTAQISDLPHVRSHGDLILLTCVVIRKYDEGMSAVFYKDSSSFALFDGNLSEDFNCYQATPGFHLAEVEKGMITRLRQWRAGFQLGPGTMDNLLQLKDISNGKDFDLICKVLHVYYEETKKVWMLLLWDGTDAPPLSLQGKLSGEESNPLPLHIEPHSLDHNVSLKLPSFGTVLSVIADEAHENVGQHFYMIDGWVRICYMCCQVSSGMWRGFLKPSSGIRLLSKNESIVSEYERKYYDRIRNHRRVPQWVDLSSHFLTGIDGGEKVFSTLMDVLRYGDVDVKFCCFVRVVAIYPFHTQHFCSPDGRSEYGIRLTLEDPTARIHTFLRGEEWVKFFEACPVEERSTKVKMLLGVPEQHNLDDNDIEFQRNPPWVKCGIRSKDKRYYVCDTRLLAH